MRVQSLERGWSLGKSYGNPLQYSCLKNPMDRGAWRATVHRVAKSQTWLKWLSMQAYSSMCKVQFSSVTQSCPTLCDAMNCSTPGLHDHHILPEITQTHVIKSVMPSSHLILCRPLLLLPPIPPSIRVFSNELTLHMRWPKYWSFSLSISPSMNTQDWSPLGSTGWISL